MNTQNLHIISFYNASEMHTNLVFFLAYLVSHQVWREFSQERVFYQTATKQEIVQNNMGRELSETTLKK